MRRIHVPSCGVRYWVALSIASILGCNTGDAFASVFGFVSGLPILVILFVTIILLERRDQAPRQVYYWLAIVVVRTAATNLADFTSHRIGIALAIAFLTVLLLTALASARLFSKSSRNRRDRRIELPTVDLWYWAIMLIAGTLGTAIGDFSSFRSGLGLPGASLSESAIVVAALAIGSAGLLAFAVYYWFTIVGVRAAGTSVGDLFAKTGGLATSTIVMSVVLVLVLALWRDPAAKAEPLAAETA